MNILQVGYTQHRDFFVKSVLPIFFLFSVIISYPTKINIQHVRLFSNFLIIQTSKIDPPRIAFDQVNQSKALTISSEWNNDLSKKSIALQSGEANLWKTPAKDILRVRRVNLPEMVFTENDVSQYLQEQRWYTQLSPNESQRISMANEKFNTMQENWNIEEPQLKEKFQTQINSSTLKGQIELKGGLPTGPYWSIEVARYQDNVKMEDGKVDLKKSDFEISVGQFTGTLKARLKDTRNGNVIGEGSLRITGETAQQNNKIYIEKTYNDVAANWNSFYHNPRRLSGEGGKQKSNIPTNVLFASINNQGKTDGEGVYSFDQVRKGSIALLRTEAESFHPGMTIARAGENKSYPLFPEKMISALRDIIRDQNVTSEFAETGSVIWGQVLENGKPISGAEISVEGLPAYKAVYLNNLLIPDQKQKTTSENGYFIILDLPAGFHSLLAAQGDVYLSHVNTVVDDNTISSAELIINKVKNQTDIKVFDAFTGSPQQAKVEFQSLPEALQVIGYAEVSLPDVDRLSFMNVTPDSPAYLKTMMNYNDTQDYLHVPLISAIWIQSIIQQQKINLFPDRGMIVGFIDKDNYEVYLGYDSQFSRDNIVYFNAQGNLSSKAEIGGGFIIFNVNLGPQSVVIADTDSDMIETQLVDVNSEATSVIKF